MTEGTEVVTSAPRELAKVEPATSLLNFIAQAVERPEIDADKLGKLLDMQRQIVADDAKAQFNRDFIAMQAELPRIKKNGVIEYPRDKTKPDGPKYKVSSYAKWEDLDRAVRPIYLRHGFSLSFTTTRTPEALTVIAVLRHRAGHSTETPGPPLPCDASGGKNNIQGWGSAQSYGKRYAATAALNIITEGEDNDGAGVVSTEQAAELDTMMRELGVEPAKFLQQFFGDPDIRKLPAANFLPAKNMLLARQRKTVS